MRQVTSNRLRCMSILLALIATACGQLRATTSSPAAGSSAPDIDIEADWDQPIREAIEVPNMDALLLLVTFDPIVAPGALGSLEQLLVTDPTVAPEETRVVALVYVEPETSDPFYVTEAISHITQADLELLSSCQPGEVGCDTRGWSLRSLHDGIQALVIDGQVATSIATSVTWIRDGINFEVTGPKDTFTLDEAMAVANSM